jgi:hypothetical protein
MGWKLGRIWGSEARVEPLLVWGLGSVLNAQSLHFLISETEITVSNLVRLGRNK